ncbi:MAG: hypothetical protein M3014_01055 [Chloroflexota bacterium]|nr:hypothetical protein [Chloroflexota bacterium]
MKQGQDSGAGMQRLRPVRLADLTISAAPSSVAGSLLGWALLSAVCLFALKRSVPTSLMLGLAGILLHWAADLLHQFGHSYAARRTGHPMVGIHLWWLLSSSVYPPDEPTLLRQVHVRRALCGPTLSLLVTMVAAVPPLFLAAGSSAWWLAVFFWADNLLVFALGALLPLGFTDGSTLLGLYRKE